VQDVVGADVAKDELSGVAVARNQQERHRQQDRHDEVQRRDRGVRLELAPGPEHGQRQEAHHDARDQGDRARRLPRRPHVELTAPREVDQRGREPLVGQRHQQDRQDRDEVVGALGVRRVLEEPQNDEARALLDHDDQGVEAQRQQESGSESHADGSGRILAAAAKGGAG
jgi:hypothetical protein